MTDKVDKKKQAEEFKKNNAGETKTQERDTADGKKEYLDEDTGESIPLLNGLGVPLPSADSEN